MSLDASELARLSALLDQALDMDGDTLGDWLAGLQGDDALLTPTLRTLLARRAEVETGDLLDRGPSFTAPQAAAPACEFAAGELVGAYRLEREIGRGGMGEVWLAVREDGQLKRRVALKLPVLSTRRSVLAQRFARERDILATLAHPNIARLYDAGVSPAGQPYLALEYVDGQPITAYCEAHALDVRARARLLQQVLQAVQYAHASLVIHRDLKPSNVLVTGDGHAMLLDFGIAKLLQEDHAQAAETELTQLGGRAMTLEYAAPEQISGAPISTATDVWALGVLLYELVAKRRPFAGDTRGAVEQNILSGEPVPPCSGMSSSMLSRGLRADLDTIVLKALKKMPGERYATVDALAEDIDRWLRGDPVLAQADSAWYRTRKFVGKHKGAVAASVAVVAIVMAAGAVSVWQALIAREQTRVARSEAATAAAVQSFLEGVFRANSGDQVDPLKARQRTAKDLLDEGAARIDKALDDAPQAKLRVLKTLGDMYEDMGQIDDAANLHGRRAALAERVEGPRSSTLLHALADQANLLASAERLADARKVLDRAAEVHSHGPHDDQALIAFYLAQGWYGHQTDARKGLQANGLALELLRKRPPSARLVYALSVRGNLLNSLNRPREAMPLLREALALATQQASLATS
ncbi:MAG: serine/threonine-protein kinase, partial [Caldimonas sp.]